MPAKKKTTETADATGKTAADGFNPRAVLLQLLDHYEAKAQNAPPGNMRYANAVSGLVKLSNDVLDGD